MVFGVVHSVTAATMQLSSTNTAVGIAGEHDSADAGNVVYAKGDFDGDEYQDLLIGATGESTGSQDSGTLYVVYGSADAATALSSSLENADAFFHGTDYFSQLPAAVTSGDLNGDGYDDLLVSEHPNFTNGVVYLFYGSSVRWSGVISLASADAQFTAGINGGYGNGNNMSIGDINADGYGDLFIGDYGDNTTASYAGAVALFYGSATPFTGNISVDSADARWFGAAASDDLGGKIDATGDINGDGIRDVLIGSRNGDSGDDRDGGQVFLYYGATGTPLSGTVSLGSAATTIGHSLLNARSGDYFMVPGDVNGDGKDDILYGYGVINVSAESQGGGYLLYGSDSLPASLNIDTDNDALFYGDAFEEYAGETFGAGDYNGDGLADFSFSARGYENSEGTVVGGVYVVYGSTEPFPGMIALHESADHIFEGDATTGVFFTIGMSGDLNSDNKDELVIGVPTGDLSVDVSGAEGGAYVLFNDSQAPVLTLNGESDVTTYYGQSYTDAGIASAVDAVDGDVSADVTVVSTVDTATVGTYTVVYAASDSSGNTATTTRTVHVVYPEVVSAIGVDGNSAEVAYDNATAQTFPCFASGTAKPLVKLATDGQTVLCVKKNGKMIRSFNAFTGVQLSSIKIRKAKQAITRFRVLHLWPAKQRNELAVLTVRKGVARVTAVTLNTETGVLKKHNTKKYSVAVGGGTKTSLKKVKNAKQLRVKVFGVVLATLDIVKKNGAFQ